MDTHIYVWMELEHGGAEGPLMTVECIYSPLKVLHHRELQRWPSGTGGCAFHVSVVLKRAGACERARTRARTHAEVQKRNRQSLGE